MQLIAALILCAILLAIVGAAIYFANHQTTKQQRYGSWSRVLGPQFNGTAMDTREKLEETIANGQRQAQFRHKARTKKRK